MAVIDVIIVILVFLAFAYLILARMKERNPKRHKAIVGMFKSTRKIKEKFKKDDKQSIPIKLPEDARIM